MVTTMPIFYRIINPLLSILVGYSFLITFAETVKDALQFFIAAAFVSTVQNFVLLLCREAYKRDIADEIDSA